MLTCCSCSAWTARTTPCPQRDRYHLEKNATQMAYKIEAILPGPGAPQVHEYPTPGGQLRLPTRDHTDTRPRRLDEIPSHHHEQTEVGQEDEPANVGEFGEHGRAVPLPWRVGCVPRVQLARVREPRRRPAEATQTHGDFNFSSAVDWIESVGVGSWFHKHVAISVAHPFSCRFNQFIVGLLVVWFTRPVVR